MTRNVGTFGPLLLAACFAIPFVGAPSSAQADSRLACAAAATQGGAQDTAVQLVRSRPLYRFQQRPYLRIPTGVALHVRAPRGMSEADLYNLLVDCTKSHNANSPLCVPGASISVERQGGMYVVNVTSDERSRALEIQHRAARM